MSIFGSSSPLSILNVLTDNPLINSPTRPTRTPTVICDGDIGKNQLPELEKTLRNLSNLHDSLLEERKKVSSIALGSVVYCNLAVLGEHSGIYVGNNRIAHLDGNGGIELVSPKEFLARLDGKNPAISIYVSGKNGSSIGSNDIARRAMSMVGGSRDYNLVLDNCHQFTAGCLSGNFENACNFFWMLEMEAKDKLTSNEWCIWDF